MPVPFDLQEYQAAMAARWKSILAVGTGAAVVALVASLLLPAKYEATVLMAIQPGSVGQSNPTAMSPAYLESLRSYEQWVQSEGLVERLLTGERPPDITGEQFRRSALRATMVRGTRTLQVSVRLGDPKLAHTLALKLAQIAVEANGSVARAERLQARQFAEREVEEAREPVTKAQAALEQFNREARQDERWRQNDQAIERKARYLTDLADAQISLAEQEARLATLREQMAKEPEQLRLEQRGQPSDVLNPARQDLRQNLELVRTSIGGLRARCDALRVALKELGPELQRGQAELASLDSRRRTLEHDLQAAEERLKVFRTRATDSGVTVALRHEDLQISDAGVVPTRPVSPRPVLNTVLGAVLGCIAGLLYETYAWNRDRAA